MTENHPSLWLEAFPQPSADGHKYDRGHAIILGAPELTGATRLASEAASRIGAGLVSVITEAKSDVYRITLPPDIMVREVSGSESPGKKASALCAGSGGIGNRQRKYLVDSLHKQSGTLAHVLDADVLTADLDIELLNDRCVLTPHAGEFARLFGKPIAGAELPVRVAAANEAASMCGAIVVLKGAETVLAHPDGRTVVNRHASPWLAKAGTGDVLAGMITGLLAQCGPSGADIFDCACAAVWIHGEAGRRIGPGLVAGDIASHIPAVLRDLLGDRFR